MQRSSSRTSFVLPLLLALLLLLAHSVAAAHVYKHDQGAAADAVCAICAVASQLAGGSMDRLCENILTPNPGVFTPARPSSFESVSSLSPRQRGPPLHP